MAPPPRRFTFDRFVIDLDARQLAGEDGATLELAGLEFEVPAGALDDDIDSVLDEIDERLAIR